MDSFRLKPISGEFKAGTLSVMEFDGLPFVPKRMFWVKDVPAGEERGGHAHYVTEQYLICVRGAVSVTLYDGKDKDTFELSPGRAVFIPRMVWDTQKFLTGDDIVLVLCSTSYNPRDYINDWAEFKKAANV